MRLFIGIFVSKHISQQIACIQEKLREVPIDAKWVDTDSFHITVSFIGDRSKEKLHIIRNCIASVISSNAIFEITFDKVQYWPTANPKIILLSLKKGKENIASIGNQLAKELHVQNSPAHITLGRLGSDASIMKLSSINKSNFTVDSHTVDTIYIVRSILPPQGARYEKLESYSLQQS